MNKNKGLNILTLSLALSGIISTTGGLILNKMNAQPKNTKVEVKVIEKQVAKIKSNYDNYKKQFESNENN